MSFKLVFTGIWHVEDQGIRHVYIKPRTPQLNGKVERSHRTDQTEFYQLLTYTDDIDLNSELATWEIFIIMIVLIYLLTENTFCSYEVSTIINEILSRVV